ncbi:hypothetical protein BDN72DRAFT_259641, partial [Pluteus cervinus]
FWEWLTLCSLNVKSEAKAGVVIRNPDLGAYIKHLELRPSSWVFTDPIGLKWLPNNLWACDYSRQTIYDRFRLQWMDWNHIRKSFQIFRISRNSVQTAINVVPLLPNLLKLTVNMNFYREPRPNPEYYRKLWSGLRASQLRCLCLTFWAGTAVHALADAIRFGSLPSPACAFEQLEKLDLNVMTTPGGYQVVDDFANDIRTILDLGRSSIRSLRISYYSTILGDWIQPYLEAFFDSLGVFPRLKHLDYKTAGDYNYEGFKRFLTQHRSTLVRLRLTGGQKHLIPFTVFNPQATWLGSEFKADSDTVPFKFTHLAFIDEEGYTTPPPVTIGLSRFADTLTTLVLSEIGWGHIGGYGYSYQDIEFLIRSLVRRPPRNSVLLERLCLSVAAMSPELFDLMATYLVNLRDLELKYAMLVAYKDQTEADKSGIIFEKRMKEREYSEWGLQSIHIASPDEKGPYFNGKLMGVLAECIPSIQKRGLIDWSDVSIDFGSY